MFDKLMDKLWLLTEQTPAQAQKALDWNVARMPSIPQPIQTAFKGGFDAGYRKALVDVRELLRKEL